jgi:hypothetical protein
MRKNIFRTIVSRKTFNMAIPKAKGEDAFSVNMNCYKVIVHVFAKDLHRTIVYLTTVCVTFCFFFTCWRMKRYSVEAGTECSRAPNYCRVA